MECLVLPHGSAHGGVFLVLSRPMVVDGPTRPKDHRVFHVLHFVKAAFKKHALDQLTENDCLNKEAFRFVQLNILDSDNSDYFIILSLYHDSTSSFAALATQSAMLSQSASALFDRDHPSMSGKAHDIVFHEMKEDDLVSMREKLGLHPWDNESENR